MGDGPSSSSAGTKTASNSSGDGDVDGDASCCNGASGIAGGLGSAGEEVAPVGETKTSIAKISNLLSKATSLMAAAFGNSAQSAAAVHGDCSGTDINSSSDAEALFTDSKGAVAETGQQQQQEEEQEQYFSGSECSSSSTAAADAGCSSNLTEATAAPSGARGSDQFYGTDAGNAPEGEISSGECSDDSECSCSSGSRPARFCSPEHHGTGATAQADIGVRLYRYKGVNLHAFLKMPSTPLHMAASCGHEKAVDELVKATTAAAVSPAALGELYLLLRSAAKAALSHNRLKLAAKLKRESDALLLDDPELLHDVGAAADQLGADDLEENFDLMAELRCSKRARSQSSSEGASCSYSGSSNSWACGATSQSRRGGQTASSRSPRNSPSAAGRRSSRRRRASHLPAAVLSSGSSVTVSRASRPCTAGLFAALTDPSQPSTSPFTDDSYAHTRGPIKFTALPRRSQPGSSASAPASQACTNLSGSPLTAEPQTSGGCTAAEASASVSHADAPSHVAEQPAASCTLPPSSCKPQEDGSSSSKEQRRPLVRDSAAADGSGCSTAPLAADGQAQLPGDGNAKAAEGVEDRAPHPTLAGGSSVSEASDAGKKGPPPVAAASIAQCALHPAVLAQLVPPGGVTEPSSAPGACELQPHPSSAEGAAPGVANASGGGSEAALDSFSAKASTSATSDPAAGGTAPFGLCCRVDAAHCRIAQLQKHVLLTCSRGCELHLHHPTCWAAFEKALPHMCPAWTGALFHGSVSFSSFIDRLY